MNKIEDELKTLYRLNSNLLVKYMDLKYYKEIDKNVFVVQVGSLNILCLNYFNITT
jgi:hypothetical protein